MNTVSNSFTPANLLSSPPSLAPRFLEPAGLRWGRFPAPGGLLRWAHLPADDAKINCVLVGGFSEFIEKYFETMRDLARRGISVWCLDWHGQGGSERDAAFPTRPLARDFDRDAADLIAFITAMLPPSEICPRLLVAHSMGGAIGVLALHSNPKLVDAAVLSAPMLGIETGPVPTAAARALAKTGMATGFGKYFIPGAGPWQFNTLLTPRTSLTSHDPERGLIQRSWFETHPRLRVDGFTYGWLQAAFRLTARFDAPGFLEGVTTPLLLGSAGREFFVNPKRHRRAAARLPHCRLSAFPESKHELFMEADTFRDAWFAEIDAFIAERFRR